MGSDLPDYTHYVTPAPPTYLPIELPTTVHIATPTMEQLRMAAGTLTKAAETLTTEYAKQALFMPYGGVQADPTGAIVSYEGGWLNRALIYKAGAGELDIVKKSLDEYVKMQYADGSWEQQYYPIRYKDEKYVVVVEAGAAYHDIQVDSGAGMLTWAMAEYDDAINPGVSVVYKTPVRKAFNFLRAAQLVHYNAHNSGMLANQRWDYAIGAPKWNDVAFGCDSAECLLAALAVLDQYGTDLTNLDGYSIKTFANDIYESIATLLWMGETDPAQTDESYFWTQYPKDGIPWLMPAGITPQAISYVQAINAMAIYKWANGAHLDPALDDYSYLCKRALNFAINFTQGKWGGFYYHPISPIYGHGIAGDDIGIYDEFPAFTGDMVAAMNVVDATYYADRITRGINFIRLASLSGGRVYNRVKIDGLLDLGEAGVPGDGMHFRALNTAVGLLAGA